MQEHFSSDGLVIKSLEFAFKQEHVMDFTRMRALESLFSMIHQGVRNVLQYNQQHPDFPMEVSEHAEWQLLGCVCRAWLCRYLWLGALVCVPWHYVRVHVRFLCVRLPPVTVRVRTDVCICLSGPSNVRVCPRVRECCTCD